jgi:hypothetical protein
MEICELGMIKGQGTVDDPTYAYDCGLLEVKASVCMESKKIGVIIKLIVEGEPEAFAFCCDDAREMADAIYNAL